MKRYLVTGGTGLVGRALVASLVADGHEVVVLTRREPRAQARHEGRDSREAPQARGPVSPEGAGGVRYVKWDGRSAVGWGAMVDGAEAVVNLAGESIAGESLGAILMRRWSREVKEKILTSRLDAGRAVALAIAAARVKPKALLQASAVGYYGSRCDEALSEESSPGDGFTAHVCQAWEASTQDVEALGVRRVILRTGLVLAAEGGVFPLMALPFRFFLGGPLGDGRQFLPWIHLADEISAIRHLLDDPSASGPYNLSAPGPVSNRDFSILLGRVLHRPCWLRTPGFLLRAALGEKAEIVLASARALPRRLEAGGFRFAFPSAEAALADLLSR